MSERFEDFVKKHRDDFDFQEPDAALWEKIDKKLGPAVKRRNLGYLWKAAAVLLIFGFSFWAQMQIEEQPRVVVRQNYHSSHNKNIDPDPATTTEEQFAATVPANSGSNLLPEFAETEKYYTRKVNSTMKELKVYLVKYPDVANDMRKDLAELDSVYRNLKKDLGDNVAQDEIISAMIQNYRMKLQLLEDIRDELMQNSAPKTDTKNNSHETSVQL